MSVSPERPEPLPALRWRWVIVGGLVLIFLAVGGVYSWLRYAVEHAANASEAKLGVDIIRHSLTVGAGLGGVAALLFTLRRQIFLEHQQRHHERAVREEFERAKEADAQVAHDATQRRITDLRIQAVEQLGSDKPSVRIGGLHNLERLAEQYPELRQLVLDEICAYLRLQSTQRVTNSSDVPMELAHESEVLDTAQSILERHLEGASSSYWEHVRIDLTGAYLKGLNLIGSELHGANFKRARIFGAAAEFARARFHDVSFEGAHFETVADFFYAEFYGNANFNNIEFGNAAAFTRTEFRASPSFDGAEFVGDALFGDVTFENGAGFSRAKFNAPASFEDIKGAPYRHLNFNHAIARPCLHGELSLHEWPPGWQLSTDLDTDGYAALHRLQTD